MRAAQGGNLEALQLLRMHGCPWDMRTSTIAARYGHLEVIRWAREHDCPWSWMKCFIASPNRSTTEAWLLRHPD